METHFFSGFLPCCNGDVVFVIDFGRVMEKECIVEACVVLVCCIVADIDIIMGLLGLKLEISSSVPFSVFFFFFSFGCGPPGIFA